MEAVDVLDGEYRGYDDQGFVLDISTSDGLVVLRREPTRAYDEAVAQLRNVITQSPVTLYADTLDGMIRELLNLEDSARMSGRLRKAFRRLGHRPNRP